ncbi:DegV family protein [Romboutsia hominis]|uniref:DegV family protein n=1 Tax=Romboutsia hominis TaxID=1507512 RepID=UPI000A87E098|nr:DegV family protein [Romboutsia hominis]
MAVKIVTDSTSYIPKEYIQKYDISIVSLNVVMDNDSIRELDVDNKVFYDDMEKCEEIPKSSQPFPEEMLDTFEKIVKNGDSIVGIFLSSKLSGTFSNANLIKNMTIENYPDADITIIDSKTTCMQMGFAAIEGAKASLEGKSKDEIVDIVNHTLDKSNFLFTPETLEYLKKGGRIGSASALLGTLLQIKPILTVRDGITGVYTKVRTRKKAINTIANTVFEDIEKNGLGDVIVHHINCEEDGLELAKALEAKLNIPVKIQSIGPIVGVHVGPGSIGIAYFTK